MNNTFNISNDIGILFEILMKKNIMKTKSINPKISQKITLDKENKNNPFDLALINLGVKFIRNEKNKKS